MVTQVPGGGLTSVEQSLVEHIGRGEWLDLAADDEAIDEAAMRSWGKVRTCRATVIREILRGRLAAEPDPHGLRLRGARITGRLDLANLSTKVNFELRDCLLEEGIVAPDAHLATVGLSGCHLEHPTEPPLDADRLTCNMLILIKATIIGHAKTGAVLLRGAHIGLLHCGGARLCNDSGPGLRGDGLQVGRGMYLHREFTATGIGHAGTVRLTGAHIGGSLECDGASLRNDSGPALLADDLQVGQDMLLRQGRGTTGPVVGTRSTSPRLHPRPDRRARAVRRGLPADRPTDRGPARPGARPVRHVRQSPGRLKAAEPQAITERLIELEREAA